MTSPKEMADTVVRAFVEQDRKRYDETARYFAEVLMELFPGFDEIEIRSSAAHYAAALKNQDKISEAGLDAGEQLKHGGWKDVESELSKMCTALKIPEEYATRTTEFWRKHSIEKRVNYKWEPSKAEWVGDCFEADKVLTTAILGSDDFSGVLGGLYVAAVKCHDKRDQNGLLSHDAIYMGRDIMTQYYSIIKNNMKGK